MWELKINEEEGELFKVKAYNHNGILSSIKYGDNYIKDLLNIKPIEKKNNLRISIKEVR